MKNQINPEKSPCSDPTGLAEQGAVERAQASGASFDEDHALALLQRAEISAEEVVSLSRNPGALKSRKVLLALVSHLRTPRHISIPLLRRMFTFDLVQVTLTPAVAADIKRAAEEQVVVRVESLPAGEKIALARRGPGRITAELLKENDPRIVSVALENGRLAESAVVTGLMKRDTPELLYRLVSEHPKWALRREVQIALLRSPKTPLDRARALAKHFSRETLSEILTEARISELAGSLDH